LNYVFDVFKTHHQTKSTEVFFSFFLFLVLYFIVRPIAHTMLILVKNERSGMDFFFTMVLNFLAPFIENMILSPLSYFAPL
jgi:hypothetical protein